MVYLTAAVVVVGLLCLLDLVLSLGIIRRLRRHSELLNQRALAEPVGVAVGESVDDFAATTIDGEPVSSDLLAGRTLVGFFSPGCEPCAEQLPQFVEFARSLPGGRPQVLAVLAASASRDDESTDYLESLGPVARVVVEEPAGPIQTAFQVKGFPTLYQVDAGGLVAAANSSVSLLAEASVPLASPAPTA